MLWSICPFLCLSYVLSAATEHFTTAVWLLKNTNRKPMLEVKLTGQCGCLATRSGQNGNKTIASAILTAFARLLHTLMYPLLDCHQ